MVDKHRTMVTSMHEILKKMNESSILFYKSKGEVLDNVRNRLFGWVVTVRVDNELNIIIMLYI